MRSEPFWIRVLRWVTFINAIQSMTLCVRTRGFKHLRGAPGCRNSLFHRGIHSGSASVRGIPGILPQSARRAGTLRPWVISLLSISVVHAADVAPERIRNSAARAVAIIQQSQKNWYAKQSCYSCHNQILPAMAFRAAREHETRTSGSLQKPNRGASSLGPKYCFLAQRTRYGIYLTRG